MLSPKPESKITLKTWKELDDTLQHIFKKETKVSKPSATFDINEYEMTVEEFISEAKKQGYTVEKIDNSVITLT
ncbi:MAG: hypothetical protein RR494_07950 [Vagococcus sp.]|uniref:hypothetical protein n=1 Tax=Vagococcus sp. TaxID=1933889 RepID=UPI002FC7E7EC